MDFMTIGKEIYNGVSLPFCCCAQERFENKVVDDRFRIVFIKCGAGVLRINNNKVLFNAPAVFCLNEREECMLLENSVTKAFSIYFNPDAINSALNFERLRGDRSGMTNTERNDCTCLSPFITRTDNYHGQLGLGITMFRSMKQLFHYLENELDRQIDCYWPCRSRSFLIEILFLLQRIFLSPDADKGILLNNNSECVGQVMLYLHTNYEKKITIDELSRKFNINRTTLNEKFKEEMGMTAIAYLIDLRIRLSCMLLTDTLIPVAEITERVGFNDIAHFTRTFKKMTEHTPSEYRQANNWQIK